MEKWVTTVRHVAFEEPAVCAFLKDLAAEVKTNADLHEELGILQNLLTQMTRYQNILKKKNIQNWKLPPNGQPICLLNSSRPTSKTVIRSNDDSKSN